MFRYFDKVDAVNDFAVSRCLKENSLYHRKSPFLSIIRNSYHLIRVIKPQKINPSSLVENYAKNRLVETKFNLKPKLEPKKAKWKNKRKNIDDVIELN